LGHGGLLQENSFSAMGVQVAQLKRYQVESMSNTNIEMIWVDAWNELYDLIGSRKKVICLLPDFKEVSLDDCKGWLQDSAYDGFKLGLKEVWYKGHKAIQVSRYK
jgi:hypothetical protein